MPTSAVPKQMCQKRVSCFSTVFKISEATKLFIVDKFFLCRHTFSQCRFINSYLTFVNSNLKIFWQYICFFSVCDKMNGSACSINIEVDNSETSPMIFEQNVEEEMFENCSKDEQNVDESDIFPPKARSADPLYGGRCYCFLTSNDVDFDDVKYVARSLDRRLLKTESMTSRTRHDRHISPSPPSGKSSKLFSWKLITYLLLITSFGL